MTSQLLWLAILFVVLAVVATALKGASRGRKATGTLSAKRPLTEREQSMFFRLSKAMPDNLVLAQVAFSALLDTKDRPTRATFDRKVADFVICTKSFSVIAVVELDDKSHRGKERQDEIRDDMLRKAGYTVLRFANIPDTAELLKALTPVVITA